MVGNGVVFEKASDELPILRIGRRISKREIEQTIAESAEEVSSLSGTGLIQHVRGGKMQRKSVIC